MMLWCAGCSKEVAPEAFSAKQKKGKASSRRCSNCVESGVAPRVAAPRADPAAAAAGSSSVAAGPKPGGSRPRPSYCPAIPGLPEGGLLEENAKKEGFGLVGKLVGAHRGVWRAGLCALVEATLEACNDGLDDQLPLFTMLTPHHRIRLLREVAVGLLVDEVPLPPETAWHYAAYLAPLHFVGFVALPVECDLEADHFAGDDQDDDASPVPPVPKTTREELTSLSEDMMSKGMESLHEERAQAKRGKKERKAAASAGAPKPTAESLRPLKEFKLEEALKLKETMLMMQTGGTKLGKREAQRRRELVKEEPAFFEWRRLFRAFAEEFASRSDRGAPAAIMQRAVKESLLRTAEPDRDLWEQLYLLIFGELIRWPRGTGGLSWKQVLGAWGGVMYGPLDRDYDAVRFDLVRREVQKASKLYAREWTAAGSVEDFRVVAVLKDPVRDSQGGSHYLDSGDTSRLGDGDASREAAAAGFWLAALSDDEALGLLAARPLAGDVHPMYHLGRARAWSWAHIWHARRKIAGAALQKNNDHRDPTNTPGARVSAVLDATPLDLSPSSSSSSSPQDQRAAKDSWDAAPFYPGAENDTVRASPDEWTALHGDEARLCAACWRTEPDVLLKKCTACNVVFYCSRECQRSNWKQHKNLCTMLRTMATPEDS